MINDHVFPKEKLQLESVTEANILMESNKYHSLANIN